MKRRRCLDLSAAGLSMAAGITLEDYLDLEAGYRRVHPQVLARLVTLLGTTMSDLFGSMPSLNEPDHVVEPPESNIKTSDDV